ncbi:hypothetical protein H0H81_009338, partial [Sphagnurus paluster]
MVGTSWASPSQREFLVARLPAFATAQASKSLPAFWVEVHRDFFAHWPDPNSEVTEDNNLPADGKAKKGKKKEKTLPPFEQDISVSHERRRQVTSPLIENCVWPIINKHTAAVFAQESAKVKKEIEEAVENERKTKEEEKEASLSVMSPDGPLSPSQYML